MNMMWFIHTTIKLYLCVLTWLYFKNTSLSGKATYKGFKHHDATAFQVSDFKAKECLLVQTESSMVL